MTTLPSSEPLAHRNVATSQEAAQSLSRSVLRQQHLKLLRAYESHSDGLTNDEMEHVIGMRQPTITPRRLELENSGLIENIGGERRTTSSGRSAYVWRITGAGLEVLSNPA